MTKIKSLLAATVLASCGAAQASTNALFELVSGPFSNSFTFSVSSPSIVAGDTNSAGISWSGVSLLAPAVPYSAADSNPDDGFSFAGLSAGTYTITFAGSGQGGYGGFYSVTSLVPEPETYGLMLAGLAAGGFIVLRRGKR